ncbi:MAG: hypothetical protein AAF611_09225 [Bacteroidota bacterium]
MKKNLKKLALKKKAVSNLSDLIKGGLRASGSISTITDPTANTGCYDCPPTTFR